MKTGNCTKHIKFSRQRHYYGCILMESSKDLEYQAGKYCYHIDKESPLQLRIEGEEDW